MTSNQQSQQKRYNPWRDPNFIPPGMRATKDSINENPNISQETANKQQSQASKSPWSDHKVKIDQSQQNSINQHTDSSSASDDELAKALALSLENDDNRNSTEDEQKSCKKSTANDPSLVSMINQDFLNKLINMGFPRIRAEKSLIITKNSNIEDAMNWLISNEAAVDIDEPLKIVKTSKEETPQKIAIDLNKRGAPLGYKPGDEYEDLDDDLDDNAKSILKGVSKKKYTFKPQQTEKSKPLTKEDKLAQLEIRREQRRIERTKEAIEQQKERERIRKKNTQEAAEMKRKRAEIDTKMIIDNKKREEKKDKERKQKIREKIKQEKLRRKQEAEYRKNRPADQ